MGSPKRVGRLKAVSAPPGGGLLLDTIEGERQKESFAKLLDEGFGVKAPGRFLDDFPIWDEELGPGKEGVLRIGVWDKQRLVSCAGVRLAKLRVPAGSLDVALIGAVATAESHRGQGLASRTVSLAVEWARERGAAMVLLWGSEVSLYERLGFELCGTQQRLKLSELELGDPIVDFSKITLGRGWIPSLLGCLRMRGSGLLLSPADERWLEAHRHVDWYWLGDPEAPQAYAAVGRGIDLQGIVHEWGGEDPRALKTLLQLVRMERPDAQLLANPGLLDVWELGGPRGEIECLCMAKALNVKKIVEGYGIRLAPGDPLLTTPNAAVCRVLFGPSDEALPLWIWGLDAV